MTAAVLENTTQVMPTSSSTITTSPSATNQDITHIGPRSTGDKSIIIGSVLGGVALVLTCLALIFYPVLCRRRAHSSPTTSRTASRLSKTCPSPFPPPSDHDLHLVRPVTPSPRRLAIDASAPCSAHPFGTVSLRWDIEKASVHTPSGHPAIVWRGNIFGNDEETRTPKAVMNSRRRPPPQTEAAEAGEGHRQSRQPEPSVSSTFAAEMSSLLESISIKSSYSSLRSGGAVLGVPARLQTPLSVQKLRQDSCATSAGATRGSVSDGGAVGGASLSRVPSPASPEDGVARSENWTSKEHVPRGSCEEEESGAGMSIDAGRGGE
ncbi:unnamed protein product [Discula destructiva]